MSVVPVDYSHVIHIKPHTVQVQCGLHVNQQQYFRAVSLALCTIDDLIFNNEFESRKLF